MSTSVTALNQWILTKISTFLVNKEGCLIEASDRHPSSDSARVVVQDAFGFRYEVHIKTLGRLQNTEGDMEAFTPKSFVSSLSR